ncbi:MAG: SpoIIE family protein phosphatase [Planctomycetaceae bacterium]
MIFPDLHLPDSEGLATFQKIKEVADGTPIVVLSGLEHLNIASTALQQGAQDYVVKGQAPPSSLPRVAHFAVERGRRIVAERETDRVLHDLQVAHEIQQSFYPLEIKDLSGVDVAGAVWSAERACGDYYDFFPTPDNKLAIALGDVCGHGLPAALSMLQVRTAFRLLARQGVDPCQILSGVNETLLVEEDAFPRFVSLFVAQFDLMNHTLQYATAGHCGYVIRQDGQVEKLPSMTIVLGIAEVLDAPAASETVALNSGDVMLVVTDGFSETCMSDGGLFGMERTLAVVSGAINLPAGGIIQELRDEVVSFANGHPHQDDMAALVVKIK